MLNQHHWSQNRRDIVHMESTLTCECLSSSRMKGLSNQNEAV